MPEFEYNNGTKIQFEHFEPIVADRLNCSLPPVSGKPNAYPSAGYLYLSAADAADRTKAYNARLTLAEQQKVRVGILAEKTTHPLPKGIYIPYKIKNYGSMSHAMDDLVPTDFIFNESTRDKTPVKA